MIGTAIARLRLFALREFTSHWRRGLASIGVIIACAALLVAVLGIFGSLTASVDRLTTGVAGDADLEVVGQTDGGFDQSIQTDVAGVSGVHAAVPMLRMQIGVEAGQALLLGFDANVAKLKSSLAEAFREQVPLGALLGVPNGVAAGSGLGLRPGQTFRIGAATATVTAIVRGAQAQQINDGRFVVTTLPVAQSISGRPQRLDSILVVAEPGSDVGQVRSGITAAVAGRAVVADPGLRTAQAGNSIATLRYAMLTAASIALVVAAFLVFNATSMALTQRRPMISVLRALGGRGATIVSDLLLETAAAAAVAAAIGSVLGLYLGRWAIGRLPELLVQSIDARLTYLPPPYAIPVAIVACLIASVTAAALAARQVFRIAPVEALAPPESTSADTVSQRVRRGVGVVSIAGIIGSFAVAFLVPDRLGLGALALLLTASIGLCYACRSWIVAAAAAVSRRLGAPGRLGAESSARAPRRTWAAVMAVGVAVAMVVTVTGANKNLVDSAAATLVSLGRSDLYVSSAPANSNGTGPPLPAETEAAVRAVPGVAAVVGDQWVNASIGRTRVTLHGVAAGSNDIILAAASEPVRTRLLAGDGVVISRDLAASMHVAAGDHVGLQTPRGSRSVRILQVVPYFSVLTGAVALDLRQLQQWFDHPGVNTLQVSFAPGADPAAVRAGVRRAAPAWASVFTGQQALDVADSAVRQGVSMVTALTWIVALLAAVALFNTLMLSVIERRRELGVLRAIGASRAFTLRMVVAEASGIGIIGGSVGLLFGSVAHYLDASVFGQVVTIDIVYRPDPMAVVYGVAAMVLTLLGSVPPALRAARLDIVAAVATE